MLLLEKWFTTEFYPKNKTGRAVFLEEKILPRLQQPEIVFFTPWGPRYRWEEQGSVILAGDKEYQALLFLRERYDEIINHAGSARIRWIFLAADLYGTKINGLPSEMVEEYFQSLKLWVKEIVPAAEFLYWSDFQIDARPYREGMKHLFGSGFCSIDANLMTRARSTAGKMGLRSDSVEYLIERVVEAIIIEEKYRPIKISCVARYKDDKVDLELPRLYLLPENLLAPWM